MHNTKLSFFYTKQLGTASTVFNARADVHVTDRGHAGGINKTTTDSSSISAFDETTADLSPTPGKYA